MTERKNARGSLKVRVTAHSDLRSSTVKVSFLQSMKSAMQVKADSKQAS